LQSQGNTDKLQLSTTPTDQCSFENNVIGKPFSKIVRNIGTTPKDSTITNLLNYNNTKVSETCNNPSNIVIIKKSNEQRKTRYNSRRNFIQLPVITSQNKETNSTSKIFGYVKDSFHTFSHRPSIQQNFKIRKLYPISTPLRLNSNIGIVEIQKNKNNSPSFGFVTFRKQFPQCIQVKNGQDYEEERKELSTPNFNNIEPGNVAEKECKIKHPNQIKKDIYEGFKLIKNKIFTITNRAKMRRQSEVRNKDSFDSLHNIPFPVKNNNKVIKSSYSLSQKNHEFMLANTNNSKLNNCKVSAIIKCNNVKTTRNSEKENSQNIIANHHYPKFNNEYSEKSRPKLSFPISLNLNI